MADAEGATPQSDDEPRSSDTPETPPPVKVDIELCEGLPGNRAVAAVEQDGRLILLASREHVSKQARDELAEVLGELARQGSLAQSWPEAK